MPNLTKFTKIGIAWSGLVVIAACAFIWTKKDVNRHRYESMKTRARILKSNAGDYETTSGKVIGKN